MSAPIRAAGNKVSACAPPVEPKAQSSKVTQVAAPKIQPAPRGYSRESALAKHIEKHIKDHGSESTQDCLVKHYQKKLENPRLTIKQANITILWLVGHFDVVSEKPNEALQLRVKLAAALELHTSEVNFLEIPAKNERELVPGSSHELQPISQQQKDLWKIDQVRRTNIQDAEARWNNLKPKSYKTAPIKIS